ncbi:MULTISPECIES: phosphoribosylglycinamide formyltransferase [Rhizobium]|jgi:phosphoribosylglycinamide formyltransferase-1|uniref:Phosphoribosylglycinamide formyltransferase n=1 Tax=Rhizobium leguminosarum bv. trifolii (strain WSM1325) TaxID=395491 RepID=C6AU30_RHILS|nr:phosphoribosylglycinamide formyltransferase [Rhizobium leguminosarum]TBY91497.1 phosphoribosylglycinamide formyltransferase [Rhizobium leguminosarum bv. viciae]ACS55532.1 phosphoribosylglycinamide formyltransferase [Rhizobium leguminosarum bv. trifolii WSM1325]MBY2910676.1 phosphoribosylglycinamide formyltransferase [Rhizobium leguminosarum]MBY2922582.1 phosphoribosylglycinamide formyltransferase [Rhizobium leguminosarum]MBY2931943.1 phosphoribosylglycinamide formyltransferase [Rhizobium le
MSSPRKRAVVFISGSGSNMMALVAAAKAADYPAEIVGVISDKADAGGLAKAAAEGIATFAFPRKDYASKDAHEAAIFSALDELKPDILCLAGYMRLLTATFIQRYEGRMLNIHPSLLPLFPGLHTHQRAIDAGMRIAGCTVHFVTEGMDEGPVIGQAAVPVFSGDTAESLAARVLTIEHQIYPQALRLFAEGRVTMEGGKAVGAEASTAAPKTQLISLIGDRA